MVCQLIANEIYIDNQVLAINNIIIIFGNNRCIIPFFTRLQSHTSGVWSLTDRAPELQAVNCEEFKPTEHECQPMYIDIEADNSNPLDYDNYVDTD